MIYDFLLRLFRFPISLPPIAFHFLSTQLVHLAFYPCRRKDLSIYKSLNQCTNIARGIFLKFAVDNRICFANCAARKVLFLRLHRTNSLNILFHKILVVTKLHDGYSWLKLTPFVSAFLLTLFTIYPMSFISRGDLHLHRIILF